MVVNIKIRPTCNRRLAIGGERDGKRRERGLLALADVLARMYVAVLQKHVCATAIKTTTQIQTCTCSSMSGVALIALKSARSASTNLFSLHALQTSIV